MRGIYKKISAICLSLTLLLGGIGLTACGGVTDSSSAGNSASSDSSSSSTSSTAPDPVKKTADEVISELLVDEYAGTGYTAAGAENPRYAEEWT